jgi:hypothetical protein
VGNKEAISKTTRFEKHKKWYKLKCDIAYDLCCTKFAPSLHQVCTKKLGFPIINIMYYYDTYIKYEI